MALRPGDLFIPIWVFSELVLLGVAIQEDGVS